MFTSIIISLSFLEGNNEFVQAYNKADLVISKGQANYESLEAIGKEDKRLHQFPVLLT